MTETALANALADKGITPRNVAMQLAIARFQNNGGEYGVALAMLNAAYGKGSEGRSTRAGNGRAPVADASPSHDGEAGQGSVAETVVEDVPASPSTPTGRGEGLSGRAEKAAANLPSAASRPGHAKRGAIAIASIQPAMAKSLFDATRLPDGRSLREIRWSECPTLAAKWGRSVRILMAIHNHAIPPDPNATLDSIVSEGELATIINAVERLNGIH